MMNEDQPGVNTPTELASLIIPLLNKQLILPNEAIAEIISQSTLDVLDNSPEWFLGFLSWRRLQVPVISFEVLNGDDYPEASKSSRVAIINRSGVAESLNFFGLLIQDIPRLMRLAKEEIAHDTTSEPGAMEQMVVSVIGEIASIPNLGRLEESIAEVLRGGQI